VNAVAGTYTLTLTDSNGYVATKVIQVDGVLPVTASFTASAATAQTPVSLPIPRKMQQLYMDFAMALTVRLDLPILSSPAPIP